MERKSLGKTNLMVTSVGMGAIPITRLNKTEAAKVVRGVLEMGVNFIDTAYGYQSSEEKIGLGIKGKNRKDVVIASKSTATNKNLFLEHLEEGLKRLGTEYIDVYQLHNISLAKIDEVMGPGGAYEGLCQAIKQGKVKHSGFSTHSARCAKETLINYKSEFEVIQVPVNFIETKFLEEVIPLAEKLNIGIIAMKPMGGGIFEDANIAIRYLMQYKSLIPDPGIEKLEEMEEIIKITENSRALTEEEKEKIENIRREIGPHFCRRCDYCQPCSQEILISQALNIKSMVKRMPLKELITRFGPNIEKAEECTECKECLERCPYNLPIPELLKENLIYYKGLKSKFTG